MDSMSRPLMNGPPSINHTSSSRYVLSMWSRLAMIMWWTNIITVCNQTDWYAYWQQCLILCISLSVFHFAILFPESAIVFEHNSNSKYCFVCLILLIRFYIEINIVCTIVSDKMLSWYHVELIIVSLTFVPCALDTYLYMVHSRLVMETRPRSISVNNYETQAFVCCLLVFVKMKTFLIISEKQFKPATLSRGSIYGCDV